MNNGNGGAMAPMDWPGAPAGPITATDSLGNVTQDLVDINGDGLPDVVVANSDGTWNVYLNTGSGFAPPTSWVVPGSDGFIRTVTADPNSPGSFIITRDLIDVNGDSIVDLVNKSGTGWEVATNLSGGAWLLDTVTEELGGRSSITYSPSSTYPDTQFPFNYWVVSSIARDNGLAISNPQHTTATNSFSYAHGKYDASSNEFRGFGQVTETRPDGALVVHIFQQDDALKGKETQTSISDAGGKPFAMTANTWSSINNGGVYTLTLDRVDDNTYDGKQDNPKQVVTEYKYDPYGNVTEEDHHGDSSVTGDETFIFNEYVYNTEKWIVEKVKHSYTTLSIAGPHVREAWFNYDGQSDLDTPPSVGNLTREEHFLNTGANPVTTYDYDNYGNRTKTTDPEGRATSVTYDDLFHTFPTEITNAIGQTTVREFNPANGQPTTVTDPNNFVTTYRYDAFNRLIKEIKPGDSDTFPTTEIVYSLDGVPPEKVTVSRREKSGSGNNLDLIQFVDGFGKLIQTKSEYKNSSNRVTTDVYYDVMGRDYKHSNPYLADSTPDYSLPQSVPATVEEYDVMGRLVKTTNPDLTLGTTLYDHWTNTSTDENGHVKLRTYDANKNLRQVVEKNHVGVNGATLIPIDETYTTNYQYDPLGELLQSQDHLGNLVSYVYDTIGRKTSFLDPDQGRKDYVYDRVGNLIQQTDARGVITKFKYDPLNRLSKVTYPTDKGVDYQYDVDTKGTLSTVTDALGTAKYKYDSRLRKIQEDRMMDGMTWTTKWGYDSLDRVISQTYPDGNTISYTYNTMAKLSGIPSILSNIDYNERGQEVQRDYANLLSTKFDYYPDNQRLKAITTAGIQDYSYSYDSVGNVQTINTNATNPAVKRTETFTYDDLDRLVNAIDPASDGYNNFYGYNAIGNMVSEADIKSGSMTVASYTYGLGGAGPHAVTGKSDTKPVVSVFSINNGNAYSTKPQVPLNNISLGYPTQYEASEKADFSDASWQPYSTAPVFTLSSGYGKKTVYFKVRNGNGETSVVSGDIAYLLDSRGTGIPDVYNPDLDGDGIPDAWETANGINQSVPGHASLDPDHDGLTNLQEYQHGTNPNSADSDNDGWTDAQEIANGTNPNGTITDNVHDAVSQNFTLQLGSFTQGGALRTSSKYAVADTLGKAISINGLADTDGDGIPDIFDPDADNDGIPDVWERANGINQSVPGHAQLDPDHDGLTNLQEYLHGTNPNKSDSNGDGWSDYAEAYDYHTDGIYAFHPAASENYSIADGGFGMGGGNRSGKTTTVSDILARNMAVLSDHSNVSVTPVMIDFGVVDANGQTSQVTVTNSGSQTVTIGAISIAGENNLEFTPSSDTCSMKPILPSGSCSVAVTFLPAFAGAKGAQLVIPTDDPQSQGISVILAGIAGAAVVDQTPPTGGIAINRGAAYTNSGLVTLSLPAQDASGVAQMCLSNSNVCSDWQPYTVQPNWNLPEGDGTYTVYAWFRDGVGNSNVTPYTASITLDTVAPVVSAAVKGGSYNNAQTVALSSNKAGKLYYSLDGRNPSSASPVFSAPLQIGSSTELKFFAIDLAGNQSATGTEVYTILTNGVCGTSSSQTFTTAPTANLCTSGTASAVTGTGPWKWSCAGSNGGSTINCSANIQTFVLSFATSGNGSLSGTLQQTVPYGGGTSQVTANAGAGYHFSNWTGPASFTTTTTNPLVVANVTASMTITANFTPDPVNGACGTSNGGNFITAPTTNLCIAGTASGITGNGPWNWSCQGINGGNSVPCSALLTIFGPPNLTLSTLPEGASTNNPTLNITGTVTAGNGLKSVTINGTAVTADANGVFSYAFTLQQGSNTITVTAIDNVDKQTSATFSVILDTSAPLLTVVIPADNSVTAQSSVTVTGTVSETGTVQATVNGGSPQLASITGTDFSVTVNLATGTNTVVVTGADLAGNTSTVKRTIILDNTTPALTITEPNQDISIHRNTYLMRGTVSDNYSSITITVTAGGATQTPTVAADGTFQQQLTFNSEGTYAVVVKATNGAGNSTTVQRNIIYTNSSSGDVNGDGVVDISDALLALQIAIGNIAPTQDQLSRGDVAPLISGAPHPDGAIDAGDALVILEKVVGLKDWQ
ncbi:hypothetical protein GMSM_44330 [Geomonas sp. Red276]